MSRGWISSACSGRISHRRESLFKENLRECQPQGVPGSEAELEQSWGGLVGSVALCRWAAILQLPRNPLPLGAGPGLPACPNLTIFGVFS